MLSFAWGPIVSTMPAIVAQDDWNAGIGQCFIAKCFGSEIYWRPLRVLLQVIANR